MKDMKDLKYVLFAMTATLTFLTPSVDASINLCGTLGNGVTSVFDNRVTVLQGWTPSYEPNINTLYCSFACPFGYWQFQFDDIDTAADCYEFFNGAGSGGNGDTGASTATTPLETKAAQRQSCAEALAESMIEEVVGVYKDEKDKATSKLENLLTKFCTKFLLRYPNKILKSFQGSFIKSIIEKIAKKVAKTLCSKISTLFVSALGDQIEDKLGDAAEAILVDVTNFVSQEICDATSSVINELESVTGVDIDGDGETSSGGGCFASSAMIETKFNGPVQMSDLKVGELVRVSDGNFEPVLFFAHVDHDTVTDFLTLHTESGDSVTLTGNHLVRVFDSGEIFLKPASSVAPGDVVAVGHGLDADETTQVNRITTSSSVGFYAPQTRSGTIVVSNVLVSTFASDAPEWLLEDLVAVGDWAHKLYPNFGSAEGGVPEYVIQWLETVHGVQRHLRGSI